MELRELLKSDKLIIMTSHEYPIDIHVAFWGGMGVVVREVSERLVKRGYQVLVLPRKVNEYASDHPFYREQNGVHVLSLPIERFQAGNENGDLYNYFPLQEGTTALDHCYTMWRYLQKNGLKDPIIHGHDWMSTAFLREAKRENYRRILSIHLSAQRDSGIPGMRLLDKRLELEKLAGDYAQKLHYVSLDQMRSCEVYHWNNDKVHFVIPNGVDVEKYKPLESSPVEEYVLFVGRLTPIKNVVQLVHGWSKFNQNYPEVGLKILGASGVSNSDVQRAISSLDGEQRAKVDLKIEMVSEEDRIRYYQNSTICCFPSSLEAFGIVAIEAQACAKPVVVGDVGGFKENVLEGITGAHVQGQNPKSITEGLELAYLNRNPWGKNARKLVVNFFSWDELIKAYIENLYEK